MGVEGRPALATGTSGGASGLEGRTGLVSGVEGPFGAAVARTLAAAGAKLLLVPGRAADALAAEIGARVAPFDDVLADGAPLDLLVEAVPLPPVPTILSEAAGLPEALAEAARPLARFAAMAVRLRPGGSALLVSPTMGPTPEGGWLLPILALRSELVAGLARELAPRGIRVNGLAPVSDGSARLPGFLKKGAQAGPPTPLGRVAQPADVADAALWLLSAPMMTGLTLPLDGGRGL